MRRTYQLRRKLRDATASDRAEVLRFQEYLKDKTRLPADAFKAKWGDYERGLK